MKIIYNLSDIDNIAEKIVSNSKSRTFLFYGEMGVGKTTLIKSIAKFLGINHITSSPTFSIVNEYSGAGNKIFHFDFYRLNNESEAHDIGIEDYFFNHDWHFVEWPERISRDMFPDEACIIEINAQEDGSRLLIMK